MIGAVLAVRRAVHAHLLADAGLIAQLGGPRIYDEPPRAAAGPYVAYGEVEARDWSSSGDTACEQTIDLVIWAGRGSESARALEIAARVAARLHEASLAITGHRLVNLRQTGLDLRRDAKSGLTRAVVILRCVTETI